MLKCHFGLLLVNFVCFALRVRVDIIIVSKTVVLSILYNLSNELFHIHMIYRSSHYHLYMESISHMSI